MSNLPLADDYLMSREVLHEISAAGPSQRGHVHASPLQPEKTGTVVRVREGKAIVTDGPFMETKEQLAGYFLVDAENQQSAIEIAQRIPGARIGTVEIRPVREISGLPGE